MVPDGRELEMYPTRPIKCWQKAKELRQKSYARFTEDGGKSRIVSLGSGEAPFSILAGLGEYIHLAGEPYGASIGNDPAFAQACTEVVEARGYSRDLCSYLRNHWGSTFINRFYFGGKMPRPKFCFQTHICDSHAKWYQVVSEHYGIPYFSIELPIYDGEGDMALREQYLLGQLQEAIPWLESVTGKKYNDELLIQAVENEYKALSLWGEICLLNQNIPAPLDQKTILSFYSLAVYKRGEKELADFYQELRDEVQERVRDGIAALAQEKCRILDDSQPLWPFLQLYRFMEKYGAVAIGSLYTFSLMGNYDFKPDGSWTRKQSLKERGITLKTRDDALRLLVELYLERPMNVCCTLPWVKSKVMSMLFREWRCNGVIIHLNRGCELTTSGAVENRLALQKEGIPVATFEGNMGDKREVDPAQVMDRLETFLVSLGLGMGQEI